MDNNIAVNGEPTTVVGSEATDTVFEKDFLPFAIRTGRITNCLGILFSFAPALVLLFAFGITPPPSAVLTAFIAITSAVGMLWFIEPISYFPVIGVAGTFMAFLTGNISNLRIPCATVAQKVAEVEPGTKEGSIIATLGMAISVLVNIVILTLGVFFGAFILSRMPESVNKALGTYLLPALFGALFTQFALTKWKIAPIALFIGIMLALFVPPTLSFLVTLCTVFGTILIAMVLYKKNLI